MAILDDVLSDVIRRTEIRRCLEEGVGRRLNELVRWYRSGNLFGSGHSLI